MRTQPPLPIRPHVTTINWTVSYFYVLTLKVTRHTVTQTEIWSIYVAWDFSLWGLWPSRSCLELWNAGKAKKFSLIAKCQLAVAICRSKLHLSHASAICPLNWTRDLITSAISWQHDKLQCLFLTRMSYSFPTPLGNSTFVCLPGTCPRREVNNNLDFCLLKLCSEVYYQYKQDGGCPLCVFCNHKASQNTDRSLKFRQ